MRPPATRAYHAFSFGDHPVGDAPEGVVVANRGHHAHGLFVDDNAQPGPARHGHVPVTTVDDWRVGEVVEQAPARDSGCPGSAPGSPCWACRRRPAGRRAARKARTLDDRPSLAHDGPAGHAADAASVATYRRRVLATVHEVRDNSHHRAPPTQSSVITAAAPRATRPLSSHRRYPWPRGASSPRASHLTQSRPHVVRSVRRRTRRDRSQ